jgi:hypothetical protein
LLDAMRAWLDESLTRLSSKSDTTAAIRYALTRWDALVCFCEDGGLALPERSSPDAYPKSEESCKTKFRQMPSTSLDKS